MSKDIRSFFTTLSKKPAPTKTETQSGKKKSIGDINTSDDIIPGTPEDVINKKKPDKSKRKRIVVEISSDSDDNKKTIPAKKSKKEHSKPIQKPTKVNEDNKIGSSTKPSERSVPKKKLNPLLAFGNEPVKQVKVPIKQPELNIHEDDDFDKTLIDLDDELFQSTETSKTETPKKTLVSSDKSKKKEQKDAQKPSIISISSDDSSSPAKEILVDKINSIKVEQKEMKKPSVTSVSSEDSKITPKKTKREIPSSSKKMASVKKEKTPSRKRKLNDDDEDGPTMDPDEERFEKKRHSAMLYQKYLNRSGPAHLGAKWIPKGKPNCLSGLCFILTGVFDSMQRNEAQTLIVEHGGRCTHSVSGKVNYMVLGDDAGPSKVEKARKLGTKIISEDDLIDLICIKSNIQNQNVKKPTSDTIASENSELSEENSELLPVKEKYKVLVQEKQKTDKEVKKSLKEEKISPVKKSPVKVKPPAKIEKISDDEDEIPSTTFKTDINYEIAKPTPKIESTKITPSVNIPTKPAEKIVTDVGSLAWVEKYKPKDITQIIGQQGEKSNMNKLIRWLQNWDKHREKEAKGKGVPKPSPWLKDDDGGYFRAALLSGSPGIGKTTTVNLVCKHLGYDTVEFNASDTRNKRMVHEEVAHILNTTSLAGYAAGGAAPTKHHVLIMDEVDGMSGNEDRGGIQELIGLIKTSNVPIICMCNDRQHQKIRTLANYCFDLRFAKPRLEQIRGAMMSVCFKEKLPLKLDAVTQVIQSTDQDVRQTLNQLSLLAAGVKVSSDPSQMAQQVRAQHKDTKLGPWEVVRKVFSEEDHKTMSFMDHSKLFFYDYSIGPLFVQENYLKVVPHCPQSKHLKRFAAAADSISMGDVIDSGIRTTQNWSMLEMQAMYASVLPGHYLRGHMSGQIDFPAWLGKNSKATKFKRLMAEVHGHTRMSTSCDRTSVNLDLVKPLRDAISGPLLKDGADGIAEAVEVMRAYNLLRDDLTSIVELARWPKTKDPFDLIDSKVKAAFTRAYNKEKLILPYAAPSVAAAKKRRKVASSEELYGEDGEEESEEEDDDAINTAMVKIKKPAAAKGASKASTSKAKTKTTKGRDGKRGK